MIDPPFPDDATVLHGAPLHLREHRSNELVEMIRAELEIADRSVVVDSTFSSEVIAAALAMFPSGSWDTSEDGMSAAWVDAGRGHLTRISRHVREYHGVGTVVAAMSQRLPMLGDIVTPHPYDHDTGAGHGPLASGCERYDDAVVVRVSPFALVSRGTDMIWYCTVERSDFAVTGRADFGLFEACRVRLTYGLTNRRVKRERSKARRRLGNTSQRVRLSPA